LGTYTLPKPDRSFVERARWIAEEEIPIAPTSDGRTWELRLLPPFGVDRAFTKIGVADAHVNNIAKGGNRGEALATVRDVIAAQNPEMDENEVHVSAEKFLQDSYTLASEVKDITDAIQIALAKKIVTPEDIKHPDQYDAVMESSFGGNFLCVDITGVWDEEKRTLQPMIIEAQQEAGMPDSMTAQLYPVCKAIIASKRATIQAALRPRGRQNAHEILEQTDYVDSEPEDRSNDEQASGAFTVDEGQNNDFYNEPAFEVDQESGERNQTEIGLVTDVGIKPVFEKDRDDNPRDDRDEGRE
jgi:hypothetical protein